MIRYNHPPTRGEYAGTRGVSEVWESTSHLYKDALRPDFKVPVWVQRGGFYHPWHRRDNPRIIWERRKATQRGYEPTVHPHGFSQYDGGDQWGYHRPPNRNGAWLFCKRCGKLPYYLKGQRAGSPNGSEPRGIRREYVDTHGFRENAFKHLVKE